MLFDWIVITTTILGSLFLSRLFSEKQKKWLIPICVCYSYGLMASAGSIDGFAHFLFTTLNFVIVMVLCNGFPRDGWKRNPTWSAFLVFWFYMFAVVFTGYFPIEGACRYINEIVTSFCSGYFLALWMCKGEGNYKRVLIFVLLAAWFVIAYSVKHGGLNSELLDGAGRAALDVDTLVEGVRQNVNHTALELSCFFPFLLIMIFRPSRTTIDFFLRLLSACAMILMTVMLIRTGARNGALIFLPCSWYFLFSSKRKGRMVGRLVIGCIILLCIIIGISFAMRRADSLRAFDYSSNFGAYDTRGDAVTSGRVSMYLNNYEKMTTIEKIFGKGFTMSKDLWSFNKRTGLYERARRPGSGNAHSMYVTVFYRSGFVGLGLFLIFLIKAIRHGLQHGDRGRDGILFLGVWMMTGVGESWGMLGGHTAILAGIAMGLLTNNLVTNPELMCKRDYQLLAQRGWRR